MDNGNGRRNEFCYENGHESDVQDLATLHVDGAKGGWRLLVRDLASFDVGVLNSLALEFAAVVKSQGPVVLEEAPGAYIPDDDAVGIQRSLSTNAPGNIGIDQR